MFKPMLTAAAVAAALVTSAGASPAQAQAPATPAPGVSLVIRDGRVTLKAEQASLRQILAEWERLGQVRVVGADKLAGGPVTLSIIDLPERQALEIVMRGVPGYMAIDRAPTATPVANTASRFDRVVVMARATTPVPATASMASGRPAPSPAQPMMPAPDTFLQPTQPDDGNNAVAQQPDRNDVDQFAATEPPMPEAPVASPYPNAYPGSPYVGANQQVGPYGGNATAAAAAAGTAAAPETQFDYANPQKYFEQRRLQQEAAGGQPTAFPSAGTGVPPGGRPTQPTATPTAPPGTLARPGIAPTPQATPPAQGQFFNPYNLPADWVPPPPVTNESGTPIEPDRAKYADPYEQPKPPEE